MDWIVEWRDDVYGPFYNMQAASDWCDHIQARESIKIRPLLEPITNKAAMSSTK